MMRKLIGENKKKSYFIFFELSPFADKDFENLYVNMISRKVLQLGASNFVS